MSGSAGRIYRSGPITVTNNGFGDTGPVSKEFKFTTELFADDLARVVGALSPHEPVHVVGGKSGGMPVLKFAMMFPHLIKTATLVMIRPEAAKYLYVELADRFSTDSDEHIREQVAFARERLTSLDKGR